MQIEDECFSLYKSIIVIELLLSFLILNFHAYHSLETNSSEDDIKTQSTFCIVVF